MAQISTQPLENLKSAVEDAVLSIAEVRRVKDAEVTTVAGDNRGLFEQAESLATKAQRERQRLVDAQVAEEMRPEVLNEQIDQFTKEFNQEARDLIARLGAHVERLGNALQRARTPESKSDSGALLARQEVERAMGLARDPGEGGIENPVPTAETPLGVMLDLASRGGELSAAAASNWGRLVLAERHPGADHERVVEAAIAATTTEGDAQTRATAAAVEQLAPLGEAINVVRRSLNDTGAIEGRDRAFGLRDALAGAFAS